MPEGDTIYRAAVNLRSSISGETVASSHSRDPSLAAESLAGHRVIDVEARGKHLLIHFDHDRVLHSHMGMTGSWHLYRPGERWRKPDYRAAVAIAFESVVAVCFSPKTLDLLTKTALLRHRYLRRLGADVLGASFDTIKVLDRFRFHNPTAIGEALLNQTIVCGIGNVYKSEVLFIRRQNPFQPVAELSDEELSGVLDTVRELMSKNLDGYPRRTRFDNSMRYWVYNRAGQPCLVCGTRIEMRRQGEAGRSTYWCPICQRGEK